MHYTVEITEENPVVKRAIAIARAKISDDLSTFQTIASNSIESAISEARDAIAEAATAASLEMETVMQDSIKIAIVEIAKCIQVSNEEKVPETAADSAANNTATNGVAICNRPRVSDLEQLGTWTHQCVQRESAVESREYAVEKRESAVRDREYDVGERESDVNQRELEVELREQVHVNCNKMLKEQARKEARDALAADMDNLEKEKARLVAKSSEVYKLEKEKAKLEEEKAKLEAENAELEAKRAEVDTKFNVATLCMEAAKITKTEMSASMARWCHIQEDTERLKLAANALIQELAGIPGVPARVLTKFMKVLESMDTPRA